MINFIKHLWYKFKPNKNYRDIEYNNLLKKIKNLPNIYHYYLLLDKDFEEISLRSINIAYRIIYNIFYKLPKNCSVNISPSRNGGIEIEFEIKKYPFENYLLELNIDSEGNIHCIEWGRETSKFWGGRNSEFEIINKTYILYPTYTYNKNSIISMILHKITINNF